MKRAAIFIRLRACELGVGRRRKPRQDGVRRQHEGQVGSVYAAAEMIEIGARRKRGSQLILSGARRSA